MDDGARRRDSSLVRAPRRRGRPFSPHAPCPMDQSLAKRPRPPSEAEQVRATQVAPHCPWPRPQHPQQPCCPTAPPHPPWMAHGGHQAASLKQTALGMRRARHAPALHWACLMAEAPLTLTRVASTRRRGPWPGGPHGHNSLTDQHLILTLILISPLWLHRARPANFGKQQTQHPDKLHPQSPSLLHLPTQPHGATNPHSTRTHPTLRDLSEQQSKAALTLGDGLRGRAGS